MASKQTISAAAFKETLSVLGWTLEEAATQLGVASRHRVGDWTSGRRPVPKYIAKAVAYRLDIHLRRQGL